MIIAMIRIKRMRRANAVPTSPFGILVLIHIHLEKEICQSFFNYKV